MWGPSGLPRLKSEVKPGEARPGYEATLFCSTLYHLSRSFFSLFLPTLISGFLTSYSRWSSALRERGKELREKKSTFSKRNFNCRHAKTQLPCQDLMFTDLVETRNPYLQAIAQVTMKERPIEPACSLQAVTVASLEDCRT